VRDRPAAAHQLQHPRHAHRALRLPTSCSRPGQLTAPCGCPPAAAGRAHSPHPAAAHQLQQPGPTHRALRLPTSCSSPGPLTAPCGCPPAAAAPRLHRCDPPGSRGTARARRQSPWPACPSCRQEAPSRNGAGGRVGAGCHPLCVQAGRGKGQGRCWVPSPLRAGGAREGAGSVLGAIPFACRRCAGRGRGGGKAGAVQRPSCTQQDASSTPQPRC